MTAPRPLHCRLILVAAVLLVFGRLLLCDFTWWDDPHTVHHNPNLNPVTWNTFVFHWTTPVASIYIPLTYTVWALVALIARVDIDSYGISLNATLFHATNILFHTGGALAAFSLLRRLLKNDLAALIGALFWAVHPLQVESVGWISGLKDVLSGTLVLASMAAYVRFRDTSRRNWYRLSLGIYVLALLAKPSAFTEPLLLIVLDYTFLRLDWKRIGRAMLPFVLVTIPLALIARAVQVAPAAHTPAWTRPFLVGDALTFYARQTLVPLHLVFDYTRSLSYLRTQPILYFAWVFPVTVAVLTFWAYRRARCAGRTLSPLVGVSLAWFVLAPLHVLGLTRFDFQVISTVADHYMYVALIGPALLLGWAVVRWPNLAGTALAVLCVYGARAAWQTPVWQDDRSLLNHCISINPRSWTSYLNLAAMEHKAHDFDAEEADIRRAQALQPDNPTVSLNLITMYLTDGDFEKAEEESQRLIRLYHSTWETDDAGPAGAHVKIVGMLISANRFDDAERYLREGLRLDPKNPALVRYAQWLVWKTAATQASH